MRKPRIDADEIAMRESIAHNLCIIERLHKLTRSEMARRCGYSRATMTRVMKAQRTPSLGLLRRIHKAFNVSYSTLMREFPPHPED